MLDSAYEQSRDPRIERWRPSDQFHCKKTVNRVEEIQAKAEKRHIKPMEKEVFKKMMMRIPRGKAPDIFNNSVENYLYGGDRVQEAIRTIVNEMVTDYEKYSDPLLSMSVSTYLYKGKNKDRTNPGSYRKVSIGSMVNKLGDCYLEDTIKSLIRDNQSELQFGFT